MIFKTDYKRIMCETRKPEDETVEKDEETEIVKNQTERSYYYDDACGYEVFVDENEIDETD